MRLSGSNLRAAGLAFALVVPGVAQAASEPGWPCVQRRVPHLSIGVLWPEQIPSPTATPQTEAAIGELATLLSLRRVEPEAARAAVESFTREHGRDPALLGEVFRRVFAWGDGRRARIVEGIARSGAQQEALAASIDDTRRQIDTASAAASPDHDAIDRLEEKLDWDERIFTERRQTTTYLCETPALIEKHLFGVARLLKDAAGGA